MATYKVTLINKNQSFLKTIDVPDTEYILGEAAEYGIKIPFECVVGSCAMCQAKIVSGTVDQSEQMFLSEKQISEGYVLTCVAKPTSNCILEIELENYL
ncbi:2Fe-2S iron-sulfur cluster-binding protein [Aerosakkonema funiforme]|uniref:2Fe-2S iron-sulfur cluster binding domain-containing protein n=1 Tax=Aerosakkonema funiforme FACHB-1375 TaxID=2949571 RepID=A0A926ZGI9_9CYAN|nr:2Fe-2S iron-sulfur cluster-binding protein [Aerosakkonema funiforme]MBD2182288.1 2Fe-2S iron-sulfur cluster binding domain-containing protein [Aerosakkonema funiforme FACHB-1375]